MPEDFEEKPPEMKDLGEILGIVRRRRWLFLGPFLLGWLLVWGVSWFLPTVYRSGTLILVEEPAVPEQYVPSNVNDSSQSRLDSITQEILSRTRLLHIIEHQHLYQDGRKQLTPDEIVDMMRKDIEIELVRADDKKLSSFNIYYSADDPKVAQAVTKELADLFIQENLADRAQKSENTTKFLEEQLEDARQNLAEQEARVREFKDKHMADLPSQLQANLQIMSSLQTQLQAAQDALSRAQQQQTYLESLLGQYRTLDQAMKGADGSTPLSVANMDKMLDQLNAQLADMRSRYTDNYPDVRKLKQQIADLERLKQQVLSNAGDQKNSPTVTSYADVKDMAPRMELASQMKANQVEIASRQRDIKELQAQLGEYQARLNASPVREQEFADITRDYNQSRTNYDALLAKKNQSEMATDLEKTQQGQRFQMIDPPNLPLTPYSPNRLKLAGFGVVAGLLLGFGFAGGAEFLDGRVYSERELRKLVSAEILADIPPLTLPEEEKRQRYEDWITIGAACLALCCVFAGFAITYYRG
ncbi:MAG TPA: XrtA system polysaccharide chain length determinant [Terriglobales bacterium]|nr:XrtA system polysaccharide chain length determinant [Terriglobales bacterium]